MKKNKDDFKKRYGKDAEAVMYATATQDGKESVLEDYVNKPIAEEQFEKLAEKKDACYQGQARYKVWPALTGLMSLVQCRKKVLRTGETVRRKNNENY